MYDIIRNLLPDLISIYRKLVTGELTRHKAYEWYTSIQKLELKTKTREERAVMASFRCLSNVELIINTCSGFEYYQRRRDFRHHVDAFTGGSFPGNYPITTVKSYLTGIKPAYMAASFKAGHELLESKGVFLVREFSELEMLTETALIQHAGTYFVITKLLKPSKDEFYLESEEIKYHQLENFFLELGLANIELIYVSPLIDSGNYELFRMDDNGNTFSIESFNSKLMALSTLAKFETRKHKQVYYIS